MIVDVHVISLLILTTVKTIRWICIWKNLSIYEGRTSVLHHKSQLESREFQGDHLQRLTVGSEPRE